MDFLRSAVSEMLNIPTRRIQFYTDQGHIPWFMAETGRGTERRYSKKDVFCLAILKQFSNSKISLDHSKSTMSLINRDWGWIFDFSLYEKDGFFPFGFISIEENQLSFFAANCDPNSLDLFTALKISSLTIVLNFKKILSEINW